MKRAILYSCAALIMTFAMTLWRFPPRAVPAEPAPSEEIEPVPPAPEAVSVIRVLNGGETVEMDMDSYLVGVLAAEMPADFEAEALKAQAVAARTYALYCARTHRHANADVCTDFSCCQAWLSDDALRQSWGADYPKRLARITEAVQSTRAQTLQYDGAPVFAAFHSSSGGATENCGDVWSALPYLVSVDSPETAENVPDFISYRALSALDFRDTVLHDYPDADFTAPESEWVEVLIPDSSGRVGTVRVGGVELSGTEMRRLFSLRSTDFTLELKAGVFLFTVTGFGHGVGMSQYGANAMAAQGAGYAQILAHYYPGTTLVSG